jgi:hypothetical protein
MQLIEMSTKEIMLLHEADLLRNIYRFQRCPICIKNNFQDKRKCSLKRGYNQSGCFTMDNYVNRKLKNKSKECFEEQMKSLYDLKKEIENAKD